MTTLSIEFTSNLNEDPYNESFALRELTVFVYFVKSKLIKFSIN